MDIDRLAIITEKELRSIKSTMSLTLGDLARNADAVINPDDR